MLLCEQNFRDVWSRNESVRAEIGQILRAHTHTHAAKLVVEVLRILLSILVCAAVSLFCACLVRVQICAPYAIAGNTHELYTCLVSRGANSTALAVDLLLFS